LAELSQQLSKFGQLKKSRSSKKSRSELAQKWMRSMDAFLTGLGHLCNRLDNGNTKGLFHKLFLRPLADAQAVERDLQEKYANKIVELTKSLSKETLTNMRKYIPEAKQWLGADYTLEDLISIGLNMGNEHNLQRLKDGNGFGKEKLDWVKSYLNKEHWDYIQAIWDTLEGMYPMLEEHHKKMSGLDMDKVFPIPVKTKYGDYRGGYFPIVYDREFSPEMESKSALFDADYGRATTSKGYTKKRNQHVNAPIKLGLSNVSAHMNTVIHDVAYRGILRKLWNLNNNTEFVEMFDATIGKEYRQNINMLLKTLGNEPNRETRGLAAWESALRWTRARATMIGLGFRLTTVLAQPLGFFSSIAVMDEHKHKQKGTHNGAFWLAKAHKELMSADIREWAFANSGELRARLGNNDATISKRIKELAVNAGNPTFKETAEVWAYKMLGYVDYYVATATWLAAYRQAQVDFGYEHADAAFYADRVMLNSQGTGNTKDAANIMQSNEGWRALSMFYSYFSSLYQMLVQLGRDTGSAKNMADYMNISARMLALVVIPSCIDQLMRGEYPDEEDEETWLGWLFTNSFEYMISSLPVVRDAYSTFKNGFGSSTNWSRQAGYFRTFIDGVGGMFDGEPNWQKTTKAALNSFAVISGYPTGGQIADTTSYFAGVAAGEIEPKSLADILYGIYKGKERK